MESVNEEIYDQQQNADTQEEGRALISSVKSQVSGPTSTVEQREEPVAEQKDVDDDEGPTYSSKWSFLLTTIGFAVGLGNFWRFPMILQRNGGGV